MTESTGGDWDQNVDVLIVGSGAGAMTAGIVAHDAGAKVLLIEKSELYGGSSAMSGGALWIPNNHLMKDAGIDDTPEDAWAYLEEITQGQVPTERRRAFLEAAPRMLEYLHEHTQFRAVAMPEYGDYYPRVKGSRPGARTLEGAAFDGRKLGADILNMRELGLQCLLMGRIAFTAAEARVLLTRAPGWMLLATKLAFRYFSDIPWRFRSKRDRTLVMGNAIIGPLRLSLMDRNVPLWMNTPATQFIEENGRVVGMVAEREGKPIRIKAEKGVILAAGGFESNQAMREKYLPNPTKAEWTCANPDNEGDLIELGRSRGAALGFMDEAWWGPVSVVPGESRARMLVIEKSLPGGVMVNQKAVRFVNEASTYVDVVNAMNRQHSPENPCIPAYLIFDSTYRKSYPVGPFLQSSQQPDFMIPKHLREANYMRKADTLRDLAEQLDLDASTLEKTIETFNTYADGGKDPEFHRGETTFEQYYGDEKVQPNPNLRAVRTPPFYALECFPGELGTKGGLVTNEHAQVLKEDGSIFEGLYATGNCSASVMGPTYAGAGATLAPTCTFGFIAAKEITGH